MTTGIGPEAFPFAFKVQQPADLVVVYTDASGTDFTLSQNAYTRLQL